MKLLATSFVPLLLSLLVGQSEAQVGSICDPAVGCNNGLQFCGTDLTCRWYTCADYYEYGPTDFTGSDGSAQLTCAPYAGPDTSTVGTDFRCGQNFSDAPLTRVDFNEICTASTPSLSGIQVFQCLAYANGTDFSSFVAETLALNQSDPCDQGNNFYSYRTRTATPTRRFTTGNQNFNFDETFPPYCIDTTLSVQAPPTTSPAPGDCASDNDCTGGFEFCGTDKACHAYSCTEWYEYGRTDFTGNDGSTELSCTDLTGTVQNITGVSFRCDNLTSTDAVRAAFDRNCTATTSITSFECWEYSEGYDFTNFINEAGLSSIQCQNASDTPRYYYDLIAQQGVAGAVIRAFGTSSAFNQEFAERTLSSIVTLNGRPTGSPGTGSPSPTAASASAFPSASPSLSGASPSLGSASPSSAPSVGTDSPSSSPSSSVAPSVSVAPTGAPSLSSAPSSSFSPTVTPSAAATTSLAPTIVEVSSNPSSSPTSTMSPTSSSSPTTVATESPTGSATPPPVTDTPIGTIEPTASVSPSFVPTASGAATMLPSGFMSMLFCVTSSALVALAVAFMF